MDGVSLKQVDESNLDDVLKVQGASYSHIPSVLETIETFEKMCVVFPAGCRLIYLESQPVGYIFFHPYFESMPKNLNFADLKLTGRENCMYLCTTLRLFQL